MIKLSKRLASIASNIDKEDKVVDIGCDHGYLSIYLKAVNGNKVVIATDINENALNMAKKNINKKFKYSGAFVCSQWLCMGTVKKEVFG